MPSRPVIKVIQNRDFLTSTPDKSVKAVSAHMKEFGVGAVLIVEEESGRLIGICTERDLNYKVLAEGLDPLATTIGSVMTADPETVGPEKPFGHVMHQMYEGGFRHMPVVDGRGRPLGVVSVRDALGLDILHFRSELELREAVGEIL